MIELFQLDKSLHFPSPAHALTDPPGLLAFGGDLSVNRLLHAYQQGIFPWFSVNEPILWWSPNPRGILPLDNFSVSKSLRKFVRKTSLRVTVNKRFDGVIYACAKVKRQSSGTWITDEMINAYIELHRCGHAHSIEVWDDGELVGGLYGVIPGNVFCGESMFHYATNASKLAMFYLVELLRQNGCEFIDCQLQNDHLASLGCIEIPRAEFLNKLKEAVKQPMDQSLWLPRELTQP
ncbi:leucyl/phenylalanyl-tRNA--protein transferase [Paraglaciecola mesophila KMM 241]|uniref:Leucyl/phenylalanyl-tRNA--protein transferase n=1 Tax=Paraglaciecola mesophila KMM 241 TaxID=1128912 RepID=K6YFE6_9ALTE|nr:leucyl/phenylalanyl-tRNA--protein transferase [Paraglaciecola mesophila]GAC22716.1 leucyl/phenylalanyl-tRNA--protein transferase [Paraglaciecola mesophila KMM 241]